MKLTADLINQSPSKLNPLKQRELDLRGLKIPIIENLGVTKDQNDLLDLTDNDIRSLSNFPLLSRLSILLISNNQISRFSSNLPFTLPNLQSLNLNNNQLTSISSLLPLAKFPRLQYLSLMGNPVARLKHYRDFLIWKLKPLRVLDFDRIKDKERSNSKSLFELEDGRPSSLSISLTTKTQEEIQRETQQEEEESNNNNNTFEVGQTSNSKGRNRTEGERGGKGRLMTTKERLRLEKLIENSSSLEEIRKLEEKLRDGFVPQEEEEEVTNGNGKDVEMKEKEKEKEKVDGEGEGDVSTEAGDAMQVDQNNNNNTINNEDEEDGVDATTLDQENANKDNSSSKKPAGRGRGRGRGSGRGKK